jgi:hypothetical protein
MDADFSWAGRRTSDTVLCQLRKFVIYRKKLLFTWSNWGMLFVERMLSLLLSSNLVGDNPFHILSQAIKLGA